MSGGVTFLTGATGYLGAYVVDHLLRAHPEERLVVMVRGEDARVRTEKLWRALQLHRGRESFREEVLPRLDVVGGDLTAPGLGLAPRDRDRLTAEVDSVLHLAASLNRKSEHACLNTNLRGTLAVTRFVRDVAARRGGLRRFGFCSTNAVAGERQSETVHEDDAPDWGRRQYDPYARTKAFCEAMVRDLAPDVPIVIYRPSIVLGDARHPRTTQFDMVQAMSWLVDLPVVPMRGDSRVDIVNADWVGRTLAELHVAPSLAHDCYHLTAGEGSVTAEAVGRAVADDLGRRPQRFVPALDRSFRGAIVGLDLLPGRNALTYAGALLKVFWPYIVYDTVFDNRRAVEAVGAAPTPFTAYGAPLYRWAKSNRFRFPYEDLG